VLEIHRRIRHEFYRNIFIVKAVFADWSYNLQLSFSAWIIFMEKITTLNVEVLLRDAQGVNFSSPKIGRKHKGVIFSREIFH
jgi:hypothetical protein